MPGHGQRQSRHEELPGEPVTLSLMDAGFITVVLDLNSCHVEVRWLRQVSAAECGHPLRLVLRIAREMQAELRKTQALAGD
ncbi:hypothetical protein [Pontibacter akesuensis]|uniref:hypothetical protein n=1 Tax=Pontibacter akesuensis TaxID=388950 RepID=UPI000AFE499E|nr:hypothetical protein [Pontibacter akesuensis]